MSEPKKDYVFNFYAEINKHIEIAGKRVLEVGCGDGRLLKLIATNNAPEYITGIDLLLSEWWGLTECSGDNWEIRKGNAKELQYADNSFDVVISVATFEHIHNVGKALSEIKRVLKPSGQFYTFFEPIWTSVIGHHFIKCGERTWNREHLSLIPPWGHLYMNETQMYEYLRSQTDDIDLILEIIQFIYCGDAINRCSRKYFMNAIMNCGMIVRHYTEHTSLHRMAILQEKGNSELTSDIRQKAIAVGYEIADLSCIGITILLEKTQKEIYTL